MQANVSQDNLSPSTKKTSGGDAKKDAQQDEAQVRKRQEQALMFEKYLEESGLSLSFQIIFTELI